MNWDLKTKVSNDQNDTVLKLLHYKKTHSESEMSSLSPRHNNTWKPAFISEAVLLETEMSDEPELLVYII